MDQPQTENQPSGEAIASIFTRHRLEPKRRVLTITAKEFVTPKMIRITATGADLSDFQSFAPDDHIKILVDAGHEKPEMRDYTPRFYNNDQQLLIVDFAVHDAGPATQWAIDAQVGDEMRIAGPRGSSQLTERFDWLFLIGDETALPAMGRWVEESGEDISVTTLGIVTEQSEEQLWSTKANHQSYWAHRPASEDTSATSAIEALRGIAIPQGKGFIWIGAEAQAARTIKSFVLEEWNHPAQYLKSSGYWVKGKADTAEK
jgi:NADPH-dependent ferric siderophore reductase